MEIVTVEAVQTVDAIGDVRDAVTLKQQLGHHLTAVKRVTGRLCENDGVIHAALE